jgi:hypothetical protein
MPCDCSSGDHTGGDAVSTPSWLPPREPCQMMGLTAEVGDSRSPGAGSRLPAAGVTAALLAHAGLPSSGKWPELPPPPPLLLLPVPLLLLLAAPAPYPAGLAVEGSGCWCGGVADICRACRTTLRKTCSCCRSSAFSAASCCTCLCSACCCCLKALLGLSSRAPAPGLQGCSWCCRPRFAGLPWALPVLNVCRCLPVFAGLLLQLAASSGTSPWSVQARCGWQSASLLAATASPCNAADPAAVVAADSKARPLCCMPQSSWPATSGQGPWTPAAGGDPRHTLASAAMALVILERPSWADCAPVSWVVAAAADPLGSRPPAAAGRPPPCSAACSWLRSSSFSAARSLTSCLSAIASCCMDTTRAAMATGLPTSPPLAPPAEAAGLPLVHPASGDRPRAAAAPPKLRLRRVRMGARRGITGDAGNPERGDPLQDALPTAAAAGEGCGGGVPVGCAVKGLWLLLPG